MPLENSLQLQTLTMAMLQRFSCLLTPFYHNGLEKNTQPSLSAINSAECDPHAIRTIKPFDCMKYC